ncbi:MAG: energy transducer TonB [Salinivirgaceae bacterium]|nr:energy transducer TonB [Salinivirgaceae bacterium]
MHESQTKDIDNLLISRKVYMYLIKRTIGVIFLLFQILFETSGQNIEKFCDYKWEVCEPNLARYYSQISKTDFGYYRRDYYIREKRLQMLGNYSDSLCEVKNGSFLFYHANGVPHSSGKYIQNKKEGLWISYYNNGIMKDSTVFLNGKIIEKSLSWHPNGYLSDSISLNDDRSGVKVSWFDNGIPSVAGKYSSDMKQNGRWKYFHKNGVVSSIEIYDESKLVNKQYFNEKGKFVSDTTNTDRQAQFKGGDQEWLKYLSNQIYFPDGYKIANADTAKVVVTFTVNENGEIENVFTSNSFDKRFDKIAENAIKKSPKWIPAIEHNRNVKQVFHQIVSFQNYND